MVALTTECSHQDAGTAQQENYEGPSEQGACRSVLSLESQSKSMEPAKVELNQPITATGRNQGSEAGSHEAMLRYILNIGVPAIKLPSSSPVSKLAVNAASLGRRCPTLSIKV